MRRRISLDEKAIDQAAAFLADDLDGLRADLAAVDGLADDPYPAEAFPFGSTGLHPLRVGRYRVLYIVTDEFVSVVHIARAPTER